MNSNFDRTSMILHKIWYKAIKLEIARKLNWKTIKDWKNKPKNLFLHYFYTTSFLGCCCVLSKGQLFWGFEVKVVGCSREQWEWICQYWSLKFVFSLFFCFLDCDWDLALPGSSTLPVFPQFPLNYESERGYIENYNSYSYDSSSFPQQYPCCEDCGDLSEADHCQTPQYTINHPIFNAHNDLFSSRTTLMEQMTTLTSMCESACQIVQKKLEEKQTEEGQAAKAQNSKIPACSDDDDDYSAITPNEPVDSLSMGDDHLNSISETKSDKLIKSCVENLVPNPSSPRGKMVKIFSNPLFEEEINSMRIDQHHYNAESDLIESLLNHDSSIIPSSSKIDSLLDEFSGELTLLKSILPGIDETDCHPENEIRLTKRLLYDNSSPRPSEEFVSKNSNAEIKSFSPSPIPIKDSDSFMEEIDLTFTLDDLMSPSIEDDDDDSEGNNLFLERLLHDDPIPLPDTLDFI
nr:hypothetical protein [Tanacetum cinerariifolium]